MVCCEEEAGTVFLMALVMAAVTAWAPVRWPSADPASLALLEGSPLNCLLLEAPQWQRPFADAAHARQLTLLGVVRDGKAESAQRAMAAGLDGIAAEGPASEPLRSWAKETGKPLVEILPRASLDFEKAAVVATAQGLWPGVRVEKDGHTEARPTSGPWIETNSGFLRYARAVTPLSSALWIANRPREDALRGEQYVRAIADAALAGARWVVSFEPAFWRSLAGKDARAVEGWQRIQRALTFHAQNEALCLLPDASGLTLLEEPSTGALISGGIVDMITAKHIPITVAPPGRFASAPPAGVKMLLNLDPSLLDGAQKEAVRDVARKGATLVNGPPGWKMALPPPEEITFSAEQIKQLDGIWREINGLVGRRNFAVRVFGAPGMLSNLKADRANGRLVLHMVNYTDYPVENIALHFTGRIKAVQLITPRGSKKLDVYEVEDGTGVDLERVEDVAIVLLEEAQPKR